MKNLKELLDEKNIDFSQEIYEIISDEETLIKLPQNLIKNLNKDLKKINLNSIHSDRKTALELIYLILSNFTFTWVREAKYKDNFVSNKFIQLNSRILKRQVGTGSNIVTRYKLILDLLMKHNYVEKGLRHKFTVKSTSYKINNKYYKSAIEKYTLSTKYAKKLNKKNMKRKLTNILDNTIAKNELENISKIELPSSVEVKEHLQTNSKKRWSNKRGKQLKTLGKKKREKEFIYVEDYVRLYELLRDNFNDPRILSERAGNRVATKFNLMPTLIRELFKIRENGNKLVGLDFSCLHPNLANRLFMGKNKEIITHEEVTIFLQNNKKYSKYNFKQLRNIAKKEHLSFFNKKVKHMENSILYTYYKENHPVLLEKVKNDKKSRGYKNTSKRLFKLETKIMSEIIKRCSKMGIITVYIYDELLVEEVFVEDVKKIMAKVCLEQKFNVIIK